MTDESKKSSYQEGVEAGIKREYERIKEIVQRHIDLHHSAIQVMGRVDCAEGEKLARTGLGAIEHLSYDLVEFNPKVLVDIFDSSTDD